jgi:sensor histidine kinase YesM
MSAAFEPVPTPDRRKNRMLLLVFGTGAATGLHLGLLHLAVFHSIDTGKARSVLAAPVAFLLFFVGGLIFSGATYVLWRWIFPHLRARTFRRQIVVQTIVSLLAIGIVSVLTVELLTLLSGLPSLFSAPVGPETWLRITPAMRQGAARMYSVLPIVPTVLLTMIGYHQYWQRILTLQHRERELTELAATAQLAALRAQINPHFLFNSLNSIAQLIHSDPDKAEACVERLADIFRYILRRAEKDLVPLAEEVQMAAAYLDIERARFGDRLRVETTIDPRSMHQLIPNLILQPLVENAVKHGLSRKLGPGTVRIQAETSDGLLTLTVGDDGLGMPATTLGSVYERGVGLRNLRDRLARLYGSAHLPEIVSAPGGGTKVRLRIPVRPAEAAA